MHQIPHPNPEPAPRGRGDHTSPDHCRQATGLPRHRATRPGAARPAHRMARRSRWPRVLIGVLAVGLVCVLVCLLGAGSAAAAPARHTPAAGTLTVAHSVQITAFQATTTAPDLKTVVGNATAWLVGILATIATFFLTLGAIRYLMAGGDPSEVERAKGSFRNAAIGYGLAVLAPVILKTLQSILQVQP